MSDHEHIVASRIITNRDGSVYTLEVRNSDLREFFEFLNRRSPNLLARLRDENLVRTEKRRRFATAEDYIESDADKEFAENLKYFNREFQEILVNQIKNFFLIGGGRGW